MAIYVGDVAITSIETITAFDITTGNLMFVLDELQNATISQAEEKTDSKCWNSFLLMVISH